MRANNDNVSVSDVPDEQKELGWGSLGIHTYIKVIIIGVLLWYLFRDQITRTVNIWKTDASWSHGFLIPFFSLYLLNQHKSQILRLKTKTNYLGLFFLICCIVFYPLNIVQFRIDYATSLMMLACLGATILFLGGWRLVRYAWLPVLYLIFAVPLPDRLYRSATIPMRRAAAQIASGMLNLVSGLETSANGVVIDVVYKGVQMKPGLDVAEACSGMRLLTAFVALGVAMAYLHYRPMWQRLVLLCCTVPIAIFCNIVRVTTMGFIYILWDPKYIQGIYHDGLGMVMLPLAFALYGFLAWFMSNLYVEEQTITEDIVVRQRSSQTTG